MLFPFAEYVAVIPEFHVLFRRQTRFHIPERTMKYIFIRKIVHTSQRKITKRHDTDAQARYSTCILQR